LFLPSITLKTAYAVVLMIILFVVLQGGLIFVCGSRESLMEVSGRRHNADDVIATVLAVEPTKFVYRGRYDCQISYVTV